MNDPAFEYYVWKETRQIKKLLQKMNKETELQTEIERLAKLLFAKPSCYYWYGEFGIISDAPGVAEAIKEHPELPVKTLKEWEAMFSDHAKLRIYVVER